MNQPKHSDLQRLIPTRSVEAIQQKYSDASTGSDEWDVLAAAMFHFFALYGMTHSPEQHERMTQLVLHQVHNDGIEADQNTAASRNAICDKSTGVKHYYASVGEPAVQSSEIRHYSLDDNVDITPVASCDHQHSTVEDALTCVPVLLAGVSGHTAIAVVIEVDETGHRHVVPVTESMRAVARQVTPTGEA